MREEGTVTPKPSLGLQGRGCLQFGAHWVTFCCAPPVLLAIISLKNTSCLRAATRSLVFFPSSLKRWVVNSVRRIPPAFGGEGSRVLPAPRSPRMPVSPCLPAPQPAEHRAAGRSQRSVLLTKFEKGIIYVSCIFLGLTAKNGKQHWGTLIEQRLEEQPRQGTGKQPPTSRSPRRVPALSGRGKARGRGWGALSIWGGATAQKLLKDSVQSLFFPEVLLKKKKNHLFLGLSNG